MLRAGLAGIKVAARRGRGVLIPLGDTSLEGEEVRRAVEGSGRDVNGAGDGDMLAGSTWRLAGRLQSPAAARPAWFPLLMIRWAPEILNGTEPTLLIWPVMVHS